MRRALWPSIATLGAAVVIYADAVHPGMTTGGRISAADAVVVIPAIALLAASADRTDNASNAGAAATGVHLQPVNSSGGLGSRPFPP